MELTIFNVGHGSCAFLLGDPHRADAANVALLDCGHDDQTGFRPSHSLPRMGVTAVEHLVVSHYDQDHLSDLPNLRETLPIHSIWRNGSLTADQIQQLKLRSGPLEPGVEAIIAMLQEYGSGVTPQDRAAWALGGVHLMTFATPYPLFQDTNNLSLVTFLHHAQVSIILPGDLERAAWEAMLEDYSFQTHLRQVRVFIASHHGRVNGYFERIFDFCTPDIVIISDTAIQYDTQEQEYARHARGLFVNGGPERRYTLTTRRDGHLRLVTRAQGGYEIQTNVTLP